MTRDFGSTTKRANIGIASIVGWAALGALLLLTTHVARAVEVGTIEKLSGKVCVVSADRQSRSAKTEEAVHQGETVVTDTGAEALIRMRDRSTYALRQSSQFRIGEFRYGCTIPMLFRDVAKHPVKGFVGRFLTITHKLLKSLHQFL